MLLFQAITYFAFPLPLQILSHMTTYCIKTYLGIWQVSALILQPESFQSLFWVAVPFVNAVKLIASKLVQCLCILALWAYVTALRFSTTSTYLLGCSFFYTCCEAQWILTGHFSSYTLFPGLDLVYNSLKVFHDLKLSAQLQFLL